ncbi:MAG: hypothetical protein QM669_11740 [Siphonobacter sp.]
MKCLALLILFVSTCLSSWAQAGEWTISPAKNPDGTTYSGNVSIKKQGDTYTIHWKTSKGNPEGIGVLNNNILYAGYSPEPSYGVTVYDVKDGNLVGIRTTNTGQSGSEGVAGANRLVGTYDVKGQTANGTTYTGSITIARNGSVFNCTWEVGSDTYEGVGILEGRKFIASWAKGSGAGLMIYRFEPNAAMGTWAVQGNNKWGYENLVRSN